MLNRKQFFMMQGTQFIGKDTSKLRDVLTLKLIQFIHMTFDFQTEYHWGELNVKLVPMFGFTEYPSSNSRELIWVYDVNQPDNSYHVPACNLSTYSY